MKVKQIGTMGESIAFVVFGATGDLTQDKLYPALYELALKDLLPKNFCLVAVARKHTTETAYIKWMHKTIERLKGSVDESAFKRLTGCLEYFALDLYEAESYEILEDYLVKVESGVSGTVERVYYLALPPSLFETVLVNLQACDASAKMCRTRSSSVKVVVEKPFGYNYKEAKILDSLVKGLFTEGQVYRIDHYLGKAAFQNIYALRFANQFFESRWSNKHIKHIQIVANETNTAKDRGAYYDGAGAIRDMVQNHLMQLIAVLTMDTPKSLETHHLRAAKERVLAKVRLFDGKVRMIRGQYKGFLHEKGVERGSRTETSVATVFEVRNRRWKGVPILVRTAKGVAKKETGVVITFKEGDQLYPEHQHNLLYLRISPNPAIELMLNQEKPDFQFSVQRTRLSGPCTMCAEGVGDYERLLLDVLQGKQQLFTSGVEILHAWKAVEPLLVAKAHDRLRKYEVGSEGPTIDSITESFETYWKTTL